MKAITLKQPWVWAILGPAHVRKPVENRTWAPSYRGPLLIHAGRKPKTFDELRYFHASREFLLDKGQMCPDETSPEMAFSAIVGLVELTDVIDPVAAIRRFRSAAFYCSGPKCWVLERPQALRDPFPCSGAQGLWDVPEKIAHKIACEILEQDADDGHEIVPDNFLELWRLKDAGQPEEG